MKQINDKNNLINFNQIRSVKFEKVVIPKYSLFIFIVGMFVLFNSFILTKSVIGSYKNSANNLQWGKLVIHKQDNVKDEYNESKHFMILLKDIEENLSLKNIAPAFSYGDVFMTDGTGYVISSSAKNTNRDSLKGKINMIYRGKEQSFFYYDKIMYTIGDILPDKSRVVDIKNDRVLVDKGGKNQWIIAEF